jgi:hypothetical protein
LLGTRQITRPTPQVLAGELGLVEDAVAADRAHVPNLEAGDVCKLTSIGVVRRTCQGFVGTFE